MNALDDFDGQLRTWLAEGPTRIDGIALQAALDEAHATRQRRSLWPVRRSTMRNGTLWITAAAAVLIVAAGVALLSRQSSEQIGSPFSPSPTTSPIPLPSGTLEAGRYSYPPGDPVVPFDISFTVPAGWANAGWGAIERTTRSDVLMSWWTVDKVYVDPCHRSAAIDPGPTVQGLIDAFGRQVTRSPEAPVATTFGGYPAQRIVLHVPADVRYDDCDTALYMPYSGPGGADRGQLPIGSTSVYWAVDVNGSTLLVEATSADTAPQGERDQLMAIAASTTVAPLP